MEFKSFSFPWRISRCAPSTVLPHGGVKTCEINKFSPYFDYHIVHKIFTEHHFIFPKVGSWKKIVNYDYHIKICWKNTKFHFLQMTAASFLEMFSHISLDTQIQEYEMFFCEKQVNYK